MQTYTLERIDVWSLAVVVGVIGLLWGLILAITWFVAGALGAQGPGGAELLISAVGGLVSGVVVGAITAILYNAAASLAGGLELDFATGER
jgi:hypothetical protein